MFTDYVKVARNEDLKNDVLFSVVELAIKKGEL